MKSIQTLKTPQFWPAPTITFILLVLPTQNTGAEAPSDPPGKYFTSWLGNTYMDVAGHKSVTEELADLSLSPNGKIFTAGYAETWGGGAEYKADGGEFIARYDRFESGFGDPVKCVAADAGFVFWGTPGKGILRSAHGGGGRGAYTTFLAAKIITGLFVKNGKLYVSNFSDGRIQVFDIAEMTEERSWPCLNPSRLTVDHGGNVWVVRWDAASAQKPHEGSTWWGEKIVSYSSTGTAGPEITDFEKPLSLTVNNGGQLLVGGLNKHSQIWIYDIGGMPSRVGTFGAHDKADGSLVGTLRQNLNGWTGSDGQVDAACAMTVTLRKDGEYVILFENAAWASIQMYRWCPGGLCPTTRSSTP